MGEGLSAKKKKKAVEKPKPPLLENIKLFKGWLPGPPLL